MVGGFVVAAIAGLYFWLFCVGPRTIASIDPDRYYHLALSRLMAGPEYLRVLPQVADLGWGRYFPDKEFLFHLLTGSAFWLGGEQAVLWVVPLISIAILALLYWQASQSLRPVAAATLVLTVSLVSAAFLFRLSLLRPHLLEIFFFCGVLVAVLRDRPWWALAASLGFALSYHAFYVVLIVAGVALLFRRRPGLAGGRGAWFVLAGLAAGILLNPYFPSNVVMSLVHLKFALGMGQAGSLEHGMELQSLGGRNFLLVYGYFPICVLLTMAAALLRKPGPGDESNRFWFLLVLAAIFTGLGLLSLRAMEYAVPVCILLVASSAKVLDRKYWLPLHLALVLVIQGSSAWTHYRRSWSAPTPGGLAAFSRAIAQIPAKASGAKVFNCEWEAGAYILYRRPDLRFVDLLEPAFLQQASPEKYEIRRLAIRGALLRPQRELRRHFSADYVLCAAPALIEQMDSDPSNFQSLPGTQGDAVRLFAVRPDAPNG